VTGSAPAALLRYTGACHCGALRISFETARPLAPRACQCSFCRKHGARSVSDRAGSAWIEWDLEPLRYRFASRVADYVVCARCGVYVGAVADAPGGPIATLNLNAFDDPRFDLPASPVSYDGETPAEKAERRRARWTPLRPAGA
jgi:hypothetical protein